MSIKTFLNFGYAALFTHRCAIFLKKWMCAGLPSLTIMLLVYTVHKRMWILTCASPNFSLTSSKNQWKTVLTPTDDTAMDTNCFIKHGIA